MFWQTQHTFQKVYDEKTTQKQLFDNVAMPLVDDVVHGKNGKEFFTSDLQNNHLLINISVWFR